VSELTTIEGGITAPAGFQAAAVNAGIKSSKPDLALLVSDLPAVAAGTFTTNKVAAAPVHLCRVRLSADLSRAVIINSGNANACTGAQGMIDATKMGRLAAEQLSVPEDSVFVCSTGTIGVPMPMDKIASGIKKVTPALSPDGGDAAAKAIMTTDTVDKQIALQFQAGGVTVTIGGMSKGSGMIEPNMATMLGFLTTDAAVDRESLQNCLSLAVAESFNRISVDADQSTNDTVLMLANGAAGNDTLSETHPDWDIFVKAVKKAAMHLAMSIVKDGEGATKFITVVVNGAASVSDARTAARSIANSELVKTSWNGVEPNWGRVVAAVGYSGADMREDLMEVHYDDLCAVRNGVAADDATFEELSAVIAKESFIVRVELNLGDETDTVYTCDLSKEYVDINARYMS
jgi:glutamate N-acetyltransferase/amino-acid N-acetyltransferase